MISVEALYAIQECDPDGGSTEPTEAMYEAHKTWAIESFGHETWNRYIGCNWAEGPQY